MYAIRQGLVRFGEVRQGWVRQGKVWLGMAWQGKVWLEEGLGNLKVVEPFIF
jgi:hypothetical protein